MKAAALLLLAALAPLLRAQDATEALFNGTDLAGWTGDERYWSVQDGAIVGEATLENPLASNTFLAYAEKAYSNFVLVFEFQVEGFNSGVQYRSEMLENHSLRGPQADFEAPWHQHGSRPDSPLFDRFTGMSYEEGGRGFLAQRGELVLLRSSPESSDKSSIEILATLGDSEELASLVKPQQWNRYTVIAADSVLTHIVNGRVFSVTIDKDSEKARSEGHIGFQLHSGRPMKILVRNIFIKEI